MTSVTCIILDLERFYHGHALYINFCDDARQVHFPYGKCTWRVSSMDTSLTIPLPPSVIMLIHRGLDCLHMERHLWIEP